MSETGQMSVDEVGELWGKAERKVDEQREHIATLKAENDKLSKLVSGLSTLLDRIEGITNIEELGDMVGQRFQIARDAGLEVVFRGPTTNRQQ